MAGEKGAAPGGHRGTAQTTTDTPHHTALGAGPVLEHLAGEQAARGFLRSIETDTADPDALWTLLHGLPAPQRRGACRLLQTALERAGKRGAP